MSWRFSYFRKDNQYFPLVDITLKKTGKEITVKALVDSGASFSVFRPEIAEYLGIIIEKGKPVYLTGIGGRILGYLHKTPLWLDRSRIIAKIIFSREFNVSFNILGRDNFFLPFIISFLEKQKLLIIENNKLSRVKGRH